MHEASAAPNTHAGSSAGSRALGAYRRQRMTPAALAVYFVLPLGLPTDKLTARILLQLLLWLLISTSEAQFGVCKTGCTCSGGKIQVLRKRAVRASTAAGQAKASCCAALGLPEQPHFLASAFSRMSLIALSAQGQVNRRQ